MFIKAIIANTYIIFLYINIIIKSKKKLTNIIDIRFLLLILNIYSLLSLIYYFKL